MRVMLIPIVVVALRMNSKVLERRLEELKISRRIKTIQTTVFLRSARILRRVLETWRPENLKKFVTQTSEKKKNWSKKTEKIMKLYWETYVEIRKPWQEFRLPSSRSQHK